MILEQAWLPTAGTADRHHAILFYGPLEVDGHTWQFGEVVELADVAMSTPRAGSPSMSRPEAGNPAMETA